MQVLQTFAISFSSFLFFSERFHYLLLAREANANKRFRIVSPESTRCILTKWILLVYLLIFFYLTTDELRQTFQRCFNMNGETEEGRGFA